MAGQLDVLLLLDLPADAPCVVVDAVAGLPPGEIWVRPLAALVDRARALADAGRAPEPRSSHELPLDQVLALAATLRARPPAGTFVGIGGSCWDLGAPLSPAVAAALPAFAAAIATAVEAAAGAGAAAEEGRRRRRGRPGAVQPWRKQPTARAELMPGAPPRCIRRDPHLPPRCALRTYPRAPICTQGASSGKQ